MATPGEPWDIAPRPLVRRRDPGYLKDLFDGRTIGQPGFINWSYFNSPKYNRLLDPSGLTQRGEERYRAYGELDAQLRGRRARGPVRRLQLSHVRLGARSAVSSSTADLDLTAVCLK